MKAIVKSFVCSGILVLQAKVSLQKSGLADQRLKIKDQYECLVKLLEKMENAKYTNKEAVQEIQERDFGKDTCNMNQYIKKRMQNNDIFEIINMERQDISPVVYHMPQNSQPTSASIARSFSMLKKLLAKDRNFKVENVQHKEKLKKFCLLMDSLQNSLVQESLQTHFLRFPTFFLSFHNFAIYPKSV